MTPLKKYKLCSELSDLSQCCQSVRFSDFKTLQLQGESVLLTRCLSVISLQLLLWYRCIDRLMAFVTVEVSVDTSLSHVTVSVRVIHCDSLCRCHTLWQSLSVSCSMTVDTVVTVIVHAIHYDDECPCHTLWQSLSVSYMMTVDTRCDSHCLCHTLWQWVSMSQIVAVIICVIHHDDECPCHTLWVIVRLYIDEHSGFQGRESI